MVLIFSDENDFSTNDVLDWLIHWRIPFVRVNEQNCINIGCVNLDNNGFEYSLEIQSPYRKHISFEKNNLSFYWYRRGAFHLLSRMPSRENPEIMQITDALYQYSLKENMKIIQFFHHYLADVPHIGSFLDNEKVNKLTSLYFAQQVGINIPATYIIQDKYNLNRIIKSGKKYILKGIDRNGFWIKDNFSIGNFACLLSKKKIKDISDKFNYSLVQEYIDKKADIRVFYINGQIHATAIISQNDKQTKVDFRNYNKEKPNRIVPFNMPECEKVKLEKLMKIMEYESGSIDYALDKDNNLLFLEINPVGQYGFISEKCNLHLDKVIAKEICKYERTKNK